MRIWVPVLSSLCRFPVKFIIECFAEEERVSLECSDRACKCSLSRIALFHNMMWALLLPSGLKCSFLLQAPWAAFFSLLSFSFHLFRSFTLFPCCFLSFLFSFQSSLSSFFFLTSLLFSLFLSPPFPQNPLIKPILFPWDCAKTEVDLDPFHD